MKTLVPNKSFKLTRVEILDDAPEAMKKFEPNARQLMLTRFAKSFFEVEGDVFCQVCGDTEEESDIFHKVGMGRLLCDDCFRIQRKMCEDDGVFNVRFKKDKKRCRGQR